MGDLARAQKGKAAAFAGVGRGPTGVIKSVLDTSRADSKGRDEIFVDIVEKISCTFSSGGYLQTSQIDGAIQARRGPRRRLRWPMPQRECGLCLMGSGQQGLPGPADGPADGQPAQPSRVALTVLGMRLAM